MIFSNLPPCMTQPTRASTRHPRGIYTLYFTEMWERMSYYGMRALLILYMTAELARSGMGLDEATAGAIYGLYTCAVYLVALPGGCIIALGHFTLAIPDTRAFFAGLILVVLGTALLKPNASALVGHLYSEGGARRDWAFVWAALGAIVVVTGLGLAGVFVINSLGLAKITGVLIVSVAALWFTWAFLFARCSGVEKKRLVVVLVFFFSSALFWSGFEQVGSVMNLFGERHTDRVMFCWEMPASWFVSLGALLILILAVPASALWLAIAWTLATFWGVHRAAAWMLVPYLTWVSFSALLNFTLWRLNP